MSNLSLDDLRAQLESIDACLRKYVRLRAQLIEVIAFMEDDREQAHLNLIRERSRTAPNLETPAQEPPRAFQGPYRSKPVVQGDDQPRRPNPFSTTISLEG